MDLRAVIVSSVGASSHGANEPRWTWLDMERTLRERGLISCATTAAALGGLVDESGGLDGTGIAAGRAAILRNRLAFLDDGGRATLARDVARRLAFFDSASAARPAAFINVGGALVALGDTPAAPPFPPGLTLAKRPASLDPRRGLLDRMAERQIPVIHLLNLRALAARYDLPFDPATKPDWHDATVLKPTRYARAFAAVGAVVIGFALWRLRRQAELPPLPPPVDPAPSRILTSS
jgi:poly-gamma-glutamate system protein